MSHAVGKTESMTITADALSDPVASPAQSRPEPADTTAAKVRIVEWVDEVPQHRRVSPFDAVIEEIRRHADPTRIAKIQWDEKPISPNKVNQLRKRYPDCDFKQVSAGDGRDTYVSYKGNTTTA